MVADNPEVSIEELVAVLGDNAATLFSRANLQPMVQARKAEVMAAA